MNLTSFVFAELIALTIEKQQCFVKMFVLRLYPHAQRFVGQIQYFSLVKIVCDTESV